MASPVVFALTLAQAKLLDSITRPGWTPSGQYLELGSLKRRYLVQETARRWKLTAPGYSAQELVRVLALHDKTAGQG